MRIFYIEKILVFQVSNLQTNQVRSHTANSNKRQRKKKSKKSKRKGCYEDLAIAIGPELAVLAAPSIEPNKPRKTESTDPAINSANNGLINTFHSTNGAGQAIGPMEHNQPIMAEHNAFPSAQRWKDSASSGVTVDIHVMANVVQGKKRSIVTHPTDAFEEKETPMEQSVARSFSGVSSAVPVIEDGQLKKPHQTSKPKSWYFDLAEVIGPQLAAMNVQTPGDSEMNRESERQNCNRATKSSSFSDNRGTFDSH